MKSCALRLAVVCAILSGTTVSVAQQRAPQTYPYPPPPYGQQPYPGPAPVYAPPYQAPPHQSPSYPPYQAPPYSPYQAPPYQAPPPAPPPPAPREDDARSKSLLGAGITAVAGIAGTRIAVDQGVEYRTWSGGIFGAMGGGTVAGPLTVITRGSLFLGGGGGGLEGALAVDTYMGLGVPIAGVLQLWGGIGVGGRGIKNDELDATTVRLPGAAAGLVLALPGVSVMAAPTAGLTARTDYAPGDELQGRRLFRQTGAQLGYGGVAGIFSDYFSLHGSVERLAMSEPVTSGDAVACIHVFAIAACGFGQYWSARVHSPSAPNGATRLVPATQIGVTLGIGTATSRIVSF